MINFTRSLTIVVVVASTLVASIPAANARISFEAPELMTYGANAEVGDVATDGAGTWIAASNGEMNCCDADLVFRRSTDGSRTWGDVTQLNDEVLTGKGNDYHVQLAASSSQWLAVWSFSPYPDNLTFSRGILWIRSDDGGLTWSDPVSIGPETERGAPFEFVTDGSGTWIVAWKTWESPSGIHVSRSLDAGQTWTTTEIGSGTIAAWEHAAAPHLATDKQGRWVVVWHGDEGGVWRAFFSSSSDNGMSWSAQAPLDATAGATGASQVFPDVICDGFGEWAVAWVDTAQDRIFLTRATDASSWTAPQTLHSRGPAFQPWGGREYVAFASQGNGQWIVAWTTTSVPMIGADGDIVFTRSTDAGLTWTPVTTMNLGAIRDHGRTGALPYRGEYISDLAADASGTWVGQYALTAHCCARDSVYLVHSLPDCPVSPPSGCKQPLSPQAAKLGMRNDLWVRDNVIWKWSGPSNLSGEFGDPLASSDFAFCLYDQDAGSDVLVYEGEARGGASCGDKGCWVEKSDGYRFRDLRNLAGSTRQISLKSTSSGAKLAFSASGPALLAPTLPLHADSRVRAVLLYLETGACWESDFSSASINSIRRYRAESD